MIWSMCLSIISSTWFTRTYSKHVHIFFRRSTSSIYNCSHRSRSLTLARWYNWNKIRCIINLFRCLTSIFHSWQYKRTKHFKIEITFLKNKANDPVFLGLAFVVSFLSSFTPEWIIVWTGISIYNGKRINLFMQFHFVKHYLPLHSVQHYIKWLIKNVSTCLPSFVCACWKAIIWVVFVDELLPSVEEFSAEDTGVSVGWVSTLNRRRLALPGEGELKRSAADTPAGGDISTSEMTKRWSLVTFT